MSEYYEIKMIVTKKIEIPDIIDGEKAEFLERCLSTLTDRAKDNKIGAIGDFMYTAVSEDRDLVDEDFERIYFLGVIKNEQ